MTVPRAITRSVVVADITMQQKPIAQVHKRLPVAFSNLSKLVVTKSTQELRGAREMRP